MSQPANRRLVTEATLNPALEQVEAARSEMVTVATEASAAASQAQQTADALVPRMEQIETMAGLAPGEVTDAQTANLIARADTSTRDALNAQTDEAGAAHVADPASALTQELMARYVSMPVMYGPGIDRTGLTDSTAAMQAFIDAHPLQTIFIPAGIYQYTDLELSRGQSLNGAGRSKWGGAGLYFGDAGWNDHSLFGGTVLRSTAETGVSISLADADTVSEYHLADMSIIGPGAGTSTGVKVGHDTKTTVNAQLKNVEIGNFYDGMKTVNINENDFQSVIIRGCINGLVLGDNSTQNTWQMLEIQRCVDALSVARFAFSNGFHEPILQSNTGDAVRLYGANNNFITPYLENNAGDFFFDDGARGNTLLTPNVSGGSNGPDFQIHVLEGAEDNTIINAGWVNQSVVINNAGLRTTLVGGHFNLNDTGRDTITLNTRITGSPFGVWRQYVPSVLGDGWSRGDGDVFGSYMKQGKTAHFRAEVTFGSTSALDATRPMTMTLPLNAKSRGAFTATLHTPGGSTYALLAYIIPGTLNKVSLYGMGAAGKAEPFTATFPFNLASGCRVEVNGTYEVG